MPTQHKKRIFTVPNLISITRILLIPVFFLMMLNQRAFEAFLVFLLATSTDVLDGFTARLWHQKTKFGAYLDPTADKLLMTCSIIILSIPSLSIPNTIPLWLTATVIGRDLYIVTGVFIAYKLRGQITFNASFLGKASTVCQMGVLLSVLYFNFIQSCPPFLEWFYILTFILAILSGAHYTYIRYRMVFPQTK